MLVFSLVMVTPQKYKNFAIRTRSGMDKTNICDKEIMHYLTLCEGNKRLQSSSTNAETTHTDQMSALDLPLKQ